MSATTKPFTSRSNRILVEARRHIGSNPIMLRTWLHWVDQPDASSEDEKPWTDAERDHARKVLKRLAFLGGTA